jgi:hypothetical protein
LAYTTGQVARFIVFGSFVTAKLAPGGIDIFLLMEDAFASTHLRGEAAIIYFQQQVEKLQQVETNPRNYRLSAGGYLAEIDRMNLEVREYLSLHPRELKEQAA